MASKREVLMIRQIYKSVMRAATPEDILQVGPGASAEDVKTEWMARSLVVHPDKANGALTHAEANAATQKVNSAGRVTSQGPRTTAARDASQAHEEAAPDRTAYVVEAAETAAGAGHAAHQWRARVPEEPAGVWCRRRLHSALRPQPPRPALAGDQGGQALRPDRADGGVRLSEWKK